MKLKIYFFLWLAMILSTMTSKAQVTERPRPEEWNDLILGGRFMDRFLPMPVQGPLTFDTWGAAQVVPRYIQNGLEDND